jgi:hypothetical protein
MFESSPNGYFVRDLVVFHGLRKGCFVSKGFVIEPADLSAAPASPMVLRLRLSLRITALPRANRTRDECLDSTLP